MDRNSSLANFLAMVAWVKLCDCVVVEAADLRSYFSVDRLEDSRVERLLEAAEPLFPYAEKLYEVPEQRSNLSLYLSRVPLPSRIFDLGTMATSDRVALLNLVVPTKSISLPFRATIAELMEGVGKGHIFQAPA